MHAWQQITLQGDAFVRCADCGEEVWDYEGFRIANDNGCSAHHTSNDASTSSEVTGRATDDAQAPAPASLV